ncbi:hypothetical protein Ancab_016219 [Ancistrocladus abbreviatus]
MFTVVLLHDDHFLLQGRRTFVLLGECKAHKNATGAENLVSYHGSCISKLRLSTSPVQLEREGESPFLQRKDKLTIIIYSSLLKMGNASSMLTQYDIEEVQEHCNNLFSQQEILSLYERFCQLDRNAKGFISADEFLSVPEFALNPLSQRLLKMVDGLNFKGFVAFLSAFSAKSSMKHKIEFIFKVYDSDGNGKVTFNDILEVLRDLTGSFMSDKQREEVLIQVLQEAGYTRESNLLLDDFIKILEHSDLRMEVEIPVD